MWVRKKTGILGNTNTRLESFQNLYEGHFVYKILRA